MTAALLLTAALVLPARAADTAAAADHEVCAVFTKMEQLLARQTGADARTIAGLAAEIESLAPAALRWKWRAVAPLERILADPGRPVKLRLYALSFLGLTHDPLALPVLQKLLLDPEAPAQLRSAAASGLPSLDVSRRSVRTPLCAALAQETLPAETALAALREASRLGCDDPAVLEGWARRGGPRPEGRGARAAAFAVAGLGGSDTFAASRSLTGLRDFYPAGSAMRPLVLRELLKSPDAEAVTTAAEALAELRFSPARDDIDQLLAHIPHDWRFAPAPGRPDPPALIARLQAAQRRLH